MSNSTTYDISWSIQEEASSPREAAEKIWVDVFGRNLDENGCAGPDEASVFEIMTGPDTTITIDLSEPRGQDVVRSPAEIAREIKSAYPECDKQAIADNS